MQEAVKDLPLAQELVQVTRLLMFMDTRKKMGHM